MVSPSMMARLGVSKIEMPDKELWRRKKVLYL